LVLVAFSLPVWGCSGSGEPMEPAVTYHPAAIVIFPAVQIFDEVGQSLQFSFRVQDQNGFSLTWVPVSWESSDEAVVKVSSSGMVTALAPGQAEVRVVATQGNLTARSAVTVK